jgi:hypothetical protein
MTKKYTPAEVSTFLASQHGIAFTYEQCAICGNHYGEGEEDMRECNTCKLQTCTECHRMSSEGIVCCSECHEQRLLDETYDSMRGREV